MTTTHDIFVDANEVEIAQLHGAAITPGGSLGANYCVLTDKRVYHKGVSVAMGARGHISTGETIIDLKSVTGTSFSVTRAPMLLIVGILLVLAAGVLFVLNDRLELDDLFGTLAVVLAVIGVIFVLLYFVLRKKIFTLTFCGGALSFRANIATIKTLRAFSMAVHAGVEKLNTPTAAVATVNVKTEQAPAEGSAETPAAEA